MNESTNIVTFLLFLPVLNPVLSFELFVYLRLIIGILSLLHIRLSDSLDTFKSRLKSHLSSSTYHVYSYSYASASDSTFDWRYIHVNI